MFNARKSLLRATAARRTAAAMRMAPVNSFDALSDACWLMVWRERAVFGGVCGKVAVDAVNPASLSI